MTALTPPHRLTLLTTCFALIATACGDAGEEAVAEAVVTSALATNESGGVGKEVTAALDTCRDDPELAATDAASRPSVAFIPSSCATKTATGNTVHVELDACRGRFGRAIVNGGLDAVISRLETCALGAEITDSGDLFANGAPLDYYASAEVRLLDGDVRDIDWEASWAGTTRKGRSISQSSELTVVARGPENCLTIDGAAQGRVEDVDYDLELAGLALCPDECPSAGTVEARVDGALRDRSFTVDFDGSTVAQVKSSSGNTYDVEMTCSPAADSAGVTE